MRSMLFAAMPALLILASTASPATAQDVGRRDCESAERQAGRGIARGVLGGIARRGLGRLGGAGARLIPYSDTLSGSLIDRLDCGEQRKAVAASEAAVRGGVGTTSSWTSETRPGVSGASTASGSETLADGTHCLTVTDVIIVDGQETRAPKRMCRGPGQARYARA